ncbi:MULTISPECIES: HD domain-containing protein [unclassified Spirosoma]|uniref:HD domain-containing protein n=1 Tax=unclassified Spirosoma TaxID=2621999 RepID=UPI0009619228|nr:MULTISPECIES: HD domain-containing protein [unclassified Spirosoma]MBN8823192.1 HD domain-containing protein [Spirosoma sp.]OJW72657.1 MAG: phosphohydrolase [Spirosoma sp. 48-14]
MATPNKKKILNDPVYGFITIPTELLYDLVEHPYFQRLRRIKQLGLSEYVYPGALHTRFHHALGAMHLMGQAMSTLQSKGHHISNEECEAAQIAILLHDVGHGPFSHVLECCLLDDVPHEQISLMLMHDLNQQFNGALSLAIRMFEGTYERPFFHQLISSQLDMDRMDYLNRDGYYTGVAEGAIGAERIIKMLDLVDDQLVVEAKGILSVENFLNARRLMYWQVYLHKTSICCESMMIQILRRARFLSRQEGAESVFASDVFRLFLRDNVSMHDFQTNRTYLDAFTRLDDFDIWTCVKQGASHPDPIFSKLCQMLLNRRLFKIMLSTEPFAGELLVQLEKQLRQTGMPEDWLSYFLIEGQATNAAYLPSGDRIAIKLKSGNVIDIADASDLSNIQVLTNIVRRYYVCWAKNFLE